MIKRNNSFIIMWIIISSIRFIMGSFFFFKAIPKILDMLPYFEHFFHLFCHSFCHFIYFFAHFIPNIIKILVSIFSILLKLSFFNFILFFFVSHARLSLFYSHRLVLLFNFLISIFP